MGALVTRALRPIRSFNIENRAARVISKEKPEKAPMYKQNIEDMKRAMEADPNLADKLDKKNEELDARLRDVYVTSMGKPEDDITKERKQGNPDRPLPEYRKQVEDYEFGFKEPDRISYGRTTLRHAINFISAHQTSPKEVTAEKIAAEYKLKLEDVENILKYFKTFEIYLPETRKSAATFAGPANLRKKIAKLDPNLLNSEEKKDIIKEEKLLEGEKVQNKN